MKYYLTISSQNKYVWFQNTKCASTTIREYLSKYTQIDDDYQQDWTRSEYCSLQYTNFYKFAFVRNPFDRLVSTYKDKVVQTRLGGDQGPEIQYMRLKKCTFEQYIELITGPFWNKNNHWAEQYHNLPKNFKQELDYIGKIENFDRDIRKIFNNIKIKNYNEIEPKNTTKHMIYKKYYTPYLRSLVEKKFKKDLDMFEYKF